MNLGTDSPDGENNELDGEDTTWCDLREELAEKVVCGRVEAVISIWHNFVLIDLLV